ncbi:MAG: trimethylamine methyltransferase family protein, partial [Myxococcota bacterium]
MSETQTHYGQAPAYAPLSPGDLERILDATFRLLRETGVGFEHDDRTMDLFREAGCEISSEGLVKFETDLVQESLGSVAKSVKLWNRSGTESIEISDRNTLFFPGMTCINVYDPESGERRESTREDLCAISRVADFLPEIDGVCVSCKNVARSNIPGEIDEFTAMVESTTKPLEYLCEQTDSFRAVIELAAAVRGGKSQLAEKPYFLHIV